MSEYHFLKYVNQHGYDAERTKMNSVLSWDWVELIFFKGKKIILRSFAWYAIWIRNVGVVCYGFWFVCYKAFSDVYITFLFCLPKILQNTKKYEWILNALQMSNFHLWTSFVHCLAIQEFFRPTKLFVKVPIWRWRWLKYLQLVGGCMGAV